MLYHTMIQNHVKCHESDSSVQQNNKHAFRTACENIQTLKHHQISKFVRSVLISPFRCYIFQTASPPKSCIRFLFHPTLMVSSLFLFFSFSVYLSSVPTFLSLCSCSCLKVSLSHRYQTSGRVIAPLSPWHYASSGCRQRRCKIC